MSRLAESLLHDDLKAFSRKILLQLHGDRFEDEPYIGCVCDRLMQLERGALRRLIVNLPPRHLKTMLCSRIFTAWMLGRNPSLRVMIVTCNEGLAREIAAGVRQLIRSRWYSDLFPRTKLLHGRGGAMDFELEGGGGLFATTIRGAMTGRDADLLIVDDPVELRDANDEDWLSEVNSTFDIKCLSRLNNPVRAKIIVVMHRVHENDLTGHLMQGGTFDRLALPLVAVEDRRDDSGWVRKAGEVLRPKAFDPSHIEQLRQDEGFPDFQTLYQQDPSSELALEIRPDHFESHGAGGRPDGAVVLSVDTGLVAGSRNSFSVIQVWSPAGERHLLWDQWRMQASYDDLLAQLRKFCCEYRPHAVLIERAALGAALTSERRLRGWNIVAIPTDRRSKAARLRAHLNAITGGHISLPNRADIRDPFLAEATDPQRRTTDQLDAMVQYLAWIGQQPPLPPPTPRAGFGMVSSRAHGFATGYRVNRFHPPLG
jgi:phage terminase large subunit-like protein